VTGGRIELEARATPSERLVMEQFAAITSRLSELERDTNTTSRNALEARKLRSSPNIRVQIDPDSITDETIENAEFILRNYMGAEILRRGPETLWANGRLERLKSSSRWNAAKTQLLALPGIVDAETRYQPAKGRKSD
jgi:hypothetical protein